MIDRHRVAAQTVVAVALLLAVSACAGPLASGTASRRATAAPSTAPPAGPTSAPPAGPTSAPPAGPTSALPAASAVVLDQDWATVALVDVSTGETFRIADHAGKVIVIETMAIWCSNCRAQQGDVNAALQRLPAESVVYVVLDVNPNEDGASLAAYRTKNGFNGIYAIAGTQVARALAAEFGDQVLNPPLTPIVVIGTDGRVTLTEFGHKSPDEIVALAEAHGA